MSERKGYVTALYQLGNCLIEYLLQMQASRIGYTQLSLTQLKIVQEVITFSKIAPFAVLYMHQPVTLNDLWAGLCLLGAVYFIVRL